MNTIKIYNLYLLKSEKLNYYLLKNRKVYINIKWLI